MLVPIRLVVVSLPAISRRMQVAKISSSLSTWPPSSAAIKPLMSLPSALRAAPQ
jgi:hypothetical protein